MKCSISYNLKEGNIHVGEWLSCTEHLLECLWCEKHMEMHWIGHVFHLKKNSQCIFLLFNCMVKSKRKQYGKRAEKATLGWVWGSEGGIWERQKVENMEKQSVLLWGRRWAQQIGKKESWGQSSAASRAVLKSSTSRGTEGGVDAVGLGSSVTPSRGLAAGFFAPVLAVVLYYEGGFLVFWPL